MTTLTKNLTDHEVELRDDLVSAIKKDYQNKKDFEIKDYQRVNLSRDFKTLGEIKKRYPSVYEYIGEIEGSFASINNWLAGIKIYSKHALGTNNFKYIKINFDTGLLTWEITRRFADLQTNNDWKDAYEKFITDFKHPITNQIELPAHENQIITGLFHLIHTVSKTNQGSAIKPFFENDPVIENSAKYISKYAKSSHHGTRFDDKNDLSIKEYKPANSTFWKRNYPNYMCFGSPQCGKSGTFIFHLINNYLHNFIYESLIKNGEVQPIYPVPELTPKLEMRNNFYNEWDWVKVVFGKLLFKVDFYYGLGSKSVTKIAKLDDIIKDCDSVLSKRIKDFHDFSITNINELISKGFLKIPKGISQLSYERSIETVYTKWLKLPGSRTEIAALIEEVGLRVSMRKLVEGKKFSKDTNITIIDDLFLKMTILADFAANIHWDEAHWGSGKENDVSQYSSVRVKSIIEREANNPKGTAFVSGITATPTMFDTQYRNFYYSYFRYPSNLNYAGLPYHGELLHHDPNKVKHPFLFNYSNFANRYSTKSRRVTHLTNLDPYKAAWPDANLIRLIKHHTNIVNARAGITASRPTEAQLRNYLDLICHNKYGTVLQHYYHEIASDVGMTTVPFHETTKNRLFLESQQDFSIYSLPSDYRDNTLKALAEVPFLWFDNPELLAEPAASKNFVDSKIKTGRESFQLAHCIIKFKDGISEKNSHSTTPYRTLINNIKTIIDKRNRLRTHGPLFRLEEWNSSISGSAGGSNTFQSWYQSLKIPDNTHLIVVVKDGMNMAVRIDKRFKLGIDASPYGSGSHTNSDSLIQGMCGRFSGVGKDSFVLITSERYNIFLNGIMLTEGRIKLYGPNRAIYRESDSRWKRFDFFQLYNFILGKNPSLAKKMLNWADEIKLHTSGMRTSRFQLPNDSDSTFWNELLTNSSLLDEIEKFFELPFKILRPGKRLGWSTFGYGLSRYCTNISRFKGVISPSIKKILEEFDLIPSFTPQPTSGDFDTVSTQARPMWVSSPNYTPFVREERRPKSRYPWLQPSPIVDSDKYFRILVGLTVGWLSTVRPGITPKSYSDFQYQTDSSDPYPIEAQLSEIQVLLNGQDPINGIKIVNGPNDKTANGFAWPLILHIPLDPTAFIKHKVNTVTPAAPTAPWLLA